MYQTKLMGKGQLATLLISVILLSTIIAATGLPIVVSKDGQGRTIKGSVASKVTLVQVIADNYVDLDGDGVDDLRITTRLLVATHTGVMEGTSTVVQTITEDLHTNIARATATNNFYGKIGDSEPGALTSITTLISDRSDPNLYKFYGSMAVVEGSGLGGLEGICGGGGYQGAGPPAGPFTVTSHYEFRFHSPLWS